MDMMSQHLPSGSNKKWNYTSPQKMQTSIVAYTNQKAQKKLNSNHTPPSSAIERSQAAIMGLYSPPNAPKVLSNNPYKALSSEDDVDEGSTASNPEMPIEQTNPHKKGEEETDSTKMSDNTVASMETTISPPGKSLTLKKGSTGPSKTKVGKKSPNRSFHPRETGGGIRGGRR